MKRPFSSQGQAEHVIAAGRAVLASFSLFAIWLDPSEPSRYAAAAYTLLVAYTAYSLGVVFLVCRRGSILRPAALGIHGLDLAVAFLVMFFTEGSTSPFFTYFVFALVSATLRWQWRGALWTGGLALAAFVLLGLQGAAAPPDSAFQLNRTVIRGAYLLVVAFLLSYLGRHEAKLRDDLASLAAWPRAVPPRFDDALREALEQAATTLGVQRTALVWEEPEEPYVHVASWSAAEGLSRTREPPDAVSPPVAAPLTGQSFLCSDAAEHEPEVLLQTPGGFSRWRGAPLHPVLRRRFAAPSVLSVEFSGKTFRGRLFALDSEGFALDDLTLAAAVAHNVAAHVDQAGLMERLREAAAAEARVSVARDLHDGILQSLAVAGLKLELARTSVDDDPDAAQRLVGGVQHLLVDEQRRLRALTRDLRPGARPLEEPDQDLTVRISEVCERVQRHWDLCVHFQPDDSLGLVAGHVAHEACRVVHEALVNVARHGEASIARVEAQLGPRRLRLVVSDNGRGFPFQGTYELADLDAQGLGPRNLRERVGAVGGALRLGSSPAGARLEVELPVVRERI